MLSSAIEWFYPTTTKEAVTLVKKKGLIFHAGGTKILEPQPRSSVKGLIDIGGLGLQYVKTKGKTIYIGAGATFADVIAFCRTTERIPAVGNSLVNGASTPLRNRITIGGSLRDFPIWSSLYAPLLALNAQIVIEGEKAGAYALEKYAGSKLIQSKHLIRELRVTENRDVVCRSSTFHVLRFEYPIFCLSAALKMRAGVVREARIFITGVKRRYARLDSVEEFLRGKTLTGPTVHEASQKASFQFVPDYKFSASYKERAATVSLMDLLDEFRGVQQ